MQNKENENQENHVPERVLIVAVQKKGEPTIEAELRELERLVEAAGGETVAVATQSLEKFHPRTYVGKGKLEELAALCQADEIDAVVFNDELSGSQLKNLEDQFQRKITDRTALILEIFAKRASSSEGRLQVELARLRYRLPRLTGLRSDLSRAGVGISGRGPGEKRSELDKRYLLRRIEEIESKLKKLEKTREVTRKQRVKSEMPIVLMVGYTNAGKSTLMNNLVEDEDKAVFTKDMLFATLDTALRQCALPSGRNFLLGDTVGFVSKLPTTLIEAFKGTLEEVVEADLLLHVLDGSSDDIEMQYKTTMSVLETLEVRDKPMIVVYNKKDLIKGSKVVHMGDTVSISAKSGEGVDKLLEKLEAMIYEPLQEKELLLPMSAGALINQLHQEKRILDTRYEAEGIYVRAMWKKEELERWS
ncbi:GTPase HflX [Gottschalkiaceae bacterium SANA]|nr:GTPase HflX [Gottschalkiaceae bacterium SANA]